MTDPAPVEDFAFGKKKKSAAPKKQDAASKDDQAQATPAPAAEPAPVDEPAMDFGTKKKKKKAKAPGEDDAAPQTTTPAAPAPVPDAAAAAPAPAPAQADVMGFGTKKKATKKPAAAAGAPGVTSPPPLPESPTPPPAPQSPGPQLASESGASTTTTTAAAPPALSTLVITGDDTAPWAGSDRDYTYEELLARVTGQIHRNNPDAGARNAPIVIKPPAVGRDGRKTVWFNFAEICQILNRKQEHLLTFVFTELVTTGSVDGNQHLIMRGRYTPKNIETLLKKYIKEYVVCTTCGKLNTELAKENRLTFVVCKTDGSRRSVAPIKSVFVAQSSRRQRK